MAANLTDERMQQMTALVDAGVSINEIMRTMHTDHKTIKRHFPDYKPFRVGGWRDEGGAIRQVNQDLKEFERTGKITTRDEKQAKLRKLDELHQANRASFENYGGREFSI